MAQFKTSTIAGAVTLALIVLIGGVRVASAQSAAPRAAGEAPGTADDTRDANLRAYTELLRSDLRGQVVAVITQVMQFTEAEDAQFWPVYREFATELAAVNDQRIALITEYADTYPALSDETADHLARRALELEAQRQALKTKYYDRFKAVLPVKTAVRFLQVENQILLLMDLQIAAALPLAPR